MSPCQSNTRSIAVPLVAAGCLLLLEPRHNLADGASSRPEAGAPGEAIVTVHPRPSDAILANPGMGWETFGKPATDDENLPGWIPSTVCYYRPAWSELEPAPGRLDEGWLDALLEKARRAGQQVALRVKCCSPGARPMFPAWLRETGARIITTGYEDGSVTDVADLDDPIVLKAHLDFVRRLGERYDGHPDLDHVDLGSVGWWGEWHMHASTKAPLPGVKTRTAIIDGYVKAFRRTPLLIPVGAKADHLLRYAIGQGTGWRADCLGDMCGPERTRCHMNTYYPEALQGEQVMDAWKNAPIAWESCWTLDKWVKEGWSLRQIFNYALAVHGSYLNNKSSRLPDTPEVRREVERFLRRLGYRLVLRELRHPARVRPGDTVRLNMKWQNTGSAPCYRPCLLAYRLSSGTAEPVQLTSDQTVSRWMPGSVDTFTPAFFENAPDLPPGEVQSIDDRLRVPADLAPGRYALAIAVVDPGTRRPAIRLAIEGRGDDGWYPISTIDIER